MKVGSSSRPKSSTGLLRLVAWAVFAIVSISLSVLIVFAIVPEREPVPAWEASSGSPTPRDFLYVMFPVDDSVPLCDSASGNPVGTLSRAVTNSREELDAGGWVSINEPNGPLWVELSKLEFSSSKSAVYFAAFEANYASRSPVPFRHASLDFRHDSPGLTIATLELRPDDDHVERYVYDIGPSGVTPQAMYRIFGPGEALKNLGRVLTATVVALCTLLVVVWLERWDARQRKLRNLQ